VLKRTIDDSMKFNEEAHDVLRSNLNAIGVIASTLGVIIGISGMGHGFFEALQGNRATNGFIIYAVGKGNQYTRWTNGNEGAFTLIPNFLITGIFAMIIAFLLAIWSVHFIQTKRGSSVFLLIGTILFW